MEIKVATGDITKVKAGAIIVNVFQDEKKPEGDLASIDSVLDGAISRLIYQGEIKGKLNQNTVVHSLGKLPVDRVVVAGLGKREELTLEKIRGVIAMTCRLLRGKNIDSIVTVIQGDGVNGINTEEAAQAITEGALLGTYSFRKYLTKETDYHLIKQLTILTPDKGKLADLNEGQRKGKILADAANLARDMVNEPANQMTPTDMAEIASGVARLKGIDITVLEREQMQKFGMGALLAVSQGTQQPPKLIILNYRSNKSKKPDIALVGKAITFDSGGISLKPAEGMGEMKSDMGGGAAVLAAMSAIAQLKPKLNVMAVVPATENLPGGAAFKPGDVLKTFSGKTVEIISTDAEGRLILSDALEYARKEGAKRLIDVATLTGACRIALGDHCSGGFTNNQVLMDKIIAAGAEAGERIWQMPMYKEYKDQNKSTLADIKNTGGRLAGAITAAQFLAEFAGDTPWVHLDIAGTSMNEKESGYQVKGASGVPVRTLARLVISLSEK